MSESTFQQFFKNPHFVKIMEKYIPNEDKNKYYKVKKCSKLIFDNFPKKLTIVSRLDEVSVSAIRKMTKITKIHLGNCNDFLTVFDRIDSREVDELKIEGAQTCDLTTIKNLENLKYLDVKNNKVDLSFVLTLKNLETLVVGSKLEKPEILNGCDLPNLVKLDLSGTKCKSLEIGRAHV